ncbi:MAG: GntR family transcriptional regulator [Alphaproteobacteria bacterium]
MTGARAAARPAKGASAAYVHDRLREEILSLELRPGADLDEADLVARFGLSRTPVREALIRLAAGDLVQLLPNRGARVAPIGLADLPRYAEAFDLVQRAVTRLAAARRSAAQLGRIEAARDAFEALVGPGDPLALTEANRAFHLAIAEAADNAYLARHYDRLLAEGMRLLRIPFAFEPGGAPATSRAGHLAKIVAEHRAMVAAIAARDADRAEALGHAHTQLFRDRLMQYLDENGTAAIELSD